MLQRCTPEGFARLRTDLPDVLLRPQLSTQILSYRIRAVASRRAAHRDSGAIRTRYALGPGAFDADHLKVLGDLARVKLTPIQGKILRLLPGMAASKGPDA